MVHSGLWSQTAESRWLVMPVLLFKVQSPLDCWAVINWGGRQINVATGVLLLTDSDVEKRENAYQKWRTF
jgi:hypothetical protein